MSFKSVAVQVMNRLMEHPAAAPFLHKGAEQQENSKDLNQIRDMLISEQYPTAQAWMDDVDGVFAEQEQNEALSTFAQHMKNLFQKEKRNFEVKTVTTWCSEVYRLRTKLNELMTQPPPKVRTFAPNLANTKQIKPMVPMISERELRNFIKATEMITDEEDHREMVRILSEHQSDVDPGATDINYDVTKLNIETINELRKYIKSALEKKGLKYPE